MKELENKPKNVEEAIKAGWKTAEEIYECSGVCRDTFNVFLSTVRKATSEKPNSRCFTDPTANLVVKLGSAHKAYYHPKVEKAFQLYLMKNQANQGKLMNGMEVLEIKEKVESKPANVKEAENWYSLEELSQITGYAPDYIRKEVFSSMGEIPQAHSKLGGYHNSQKFYDEYILKAIKAYQLKAHGNMINADQANQTTANILSKAEEMMDLQTIAESGNVDAMKQFMNRMVAYTQIQAENKRLLEQTKQMEHALNYTAVIGWKKWSDLKKELAQSFEIFQHRISFKTVAAEAGLVKETDYAERIYGEDCFPTTMISESGIDKIYNCYDR